MEFEIGKFVTVDRYNHIDQPDFGVIIGYGNMPVSGRPTYKVQLLLGPVIESTGISIMESKDYEPCLMEERHERVFKSERQKRIDNDLRKAHLEKIRNSLKLINK